MARLKKNQFWAIANERGTIQPYSMTKKYCEAADDVEWDRLDAQGGGLGPKIAERAKTWRVVKVIVNVEVGEMARPYW